MVNNLNFPTSVTFIAGNATQKFELRGSSMEMHLKDTYGFTNNEDLDQTSYRKDLS